MLNNEKTCDKCKVSSIKKSTSFTYINLEDELCKLISNVHDSILSYVSKERHGFDIIDAEHYKRIRKNGYLNLIVYTDAIQLTKSNSKEFWPVLLSICELPQSLRDSIKNKLMFGVWLGKIKPTSNILFENLKSQLDKINENGINVRKGGDLINYKFGFYGFICDSPAKAIVMNMNQFNGYYGCPYCLNPGNLT